MNYKAGGGVIRIQANSLVVDGTIDASANDDCVSDCGGGAGILFFFILPFLLTHLIFF